MTSITTHNDSTLVTATDVAKVVETETETEIITHSGIINPPNITNTRQDRVRHVWTPLDRDKWIVDAQNSKNMKGRRDGYEYTVLNKLGHNTGSTQTQISPQDDEMAKATEATAKTILKTNKEFRPISLGFYVMLTEKIKNNKYIGQYLNRKIIVAVKGSTAHALLLQDMSQDLSCSDLDIVIYIDPYCDPRLFAEIQRSLHIILVQTLSQYKKTLDNMFFLENHNNTVQSLWGMSNDTIQDFKNSHISALNEVDLVSPFTSIEARNNCSRNSIVLVDSVAHEASVVRVEVPHFSMCEKIPLRSTPLFCSYNDTIHNSDRDFNLYRIKMNCLSTTTGHRVAADFIDVTVLSQGDVELIDFWNHGRVMNLYDKYTDIWICIPDMASCIRDLWKMLNIYDCPEQKREKRQKRLELLISLHRQTTLRDTSLPSNSH